MTFMTLKAGSSSSLTDQVKQVLEVVGTALRSVSSNRRKQALHSPCSPDYCRSSVLAVCRAAAHLYHIKIKWHSAMRETVRGPRASRVLEFVR